MAKGNSAVNKARRAEQVAYIRAHPDSTAPEIAAALGVTTTRVRLLANEEFLTIAGVRITRRMHKVGMVPKYREALLNAYRRSADFNIATLAREMSTTNPIMYRTARMLTHELVLAADAKEAPINPQQLQVVTDEIRRNMFDLKCLGVAILDGIESKDKLLRRTVELQSEMQEFLDSLENPHALAEAS